MKKKRKQTGGGGGQGGAGGKNGGGKGSGAGNGAGNQNNTGAPPPPNPNSNWRNALHRTLPKAVGEFRKGQMICYKHQRGTCQGNCGKAHVCQYCLDTSHGLAGCELLKQRKLQAGGGGQARQDPYQ